ncbi:MAG: protein tyrosine phosphatase [Alphaproteobacteria bacterium]|nr:protein tyrosine phosphatase [Alphaproteobacteria bacterium]
MPEFDLTTSSGRAAASFDAMWRDHSFLRVWWQNAHWISNEMVRTNQPWPFQIRRWGKRGIRTIVNLRGGFDTSFHQLEKQACEEAGITLVNFTVTSRGAPTKDQIHGAKALFERIAYPALMHCKSGADRAGLMGVLYLHFRKGEPIDKAARMLSWRYGHIRQGKTGILDYFFERYLRDGASNAKSLLEWVDQDYDPKALRQEFHSQWWANVLVDSVLRRE